jgi:hypothetical protein
MGLKQIAPACLIAFWQLAIGQTDYATQYFPTVYEAELAIVDGDPKTALSLYKEVFSLADPFSVDLVNAASCATEVDSLDLAIGYIGELIVKGVVLYYLETFRGCDTLRSTDAW